VSVVVLGAVVTTAAQLVQWSVTSHQVALKKRCALEAATSVLDQVSARPWRDISTASVKGLGLPAESKEYLNDPDLNVVVTDEHDQPRAKKISVEIAWAHRGAKPTQQVHLATWVFASGNEL
jgi:hypothetical protein